MAELDLNVSDFEQQNEQQTFTPIPTGDYIIALDRTEKKSSQSGTEYLEFAFTIMEGQYQGRKLWERFYIYNSKPGSVTFGKRMIASIVRATGKTQIHDTEELVGSTFLAHIVSETYNGQDRNTIKSYKPVPSLDSKPSDMSELPW